MSTGTESQDIRDQAGREKCNQKDVDSIRRYDPPEGEAQCPVRLTQMASGCDYTSAMLLSTPARDIPSLNSSLPLKPAPDELPA